MASPAKEPLKSKHVLSYQLEQISEITCKIRVKAVNKIRDFKNKQIQKLKQLIWYKKNNFKNGKYS